MKQQLAAVLKATADLCYYRGGYLADGSPWDPFNTPPTLGGSPPPITAVALKSIIDALLPIFQQVSAT